MIFHRGTVPLARDPLVGLEADIVVALNELDDLTWDIHDSVRALQANMEALLIGDGRES